MRRQALVTVLGCLEIARPTASANEAWVLFMSWIGKGSCGSPSMPMVCLPRRPPSGPPRSLGVSPAWIEPPMAVRVLLSMSFDPLEIDSRPLPSPGAPAVRGRTDVSQPLVGQVRQRWAGRGITRRVAVAARDIYTDPSDCISQPREVSSRRSMPVTGRGINTSMKTSRGPASSGRALVLGGGGVTGIAWMTGILFGLEMAGIDLRQANRLIGTSAGSVVAAQIASRMSLSELCLAQRVGASEEMPGKLGLGGALRMASAKLALSKESGLRRLGQQVIRNSESGLIARRRAVIARRLPEHAWPASDLQITAVNVESGRLEVFNRNDSVDLVDAVGASCAVPFVWPPVRIGSQVYMDGGTWSGTNVQLAADCNRVIVIAPFPLGVRREIRALSDSTTSLLISPDRTSRRTWGRNPLNPASAPAATESGITQASRIADFVRVSWEG